jgi:hypothetical protein
MSSNNNKFFVNLHHVHETSVFFHCLHLETRQSFVLKSLLYHTLTDCCADRANSMSIVVSASDQLSHQARPSNDFDDAEVFGEGFLTECGTSMGAGDSNHDFVEATEGEENEDERGYRTNDEEYP